MGRASRLDLESKFAGMGDQKPLHRATMGGEVEEQWQIERDIKREKKSQLAGKCGC